MGLDMYAFATIETIFARSRLRISPLVDADKPCALSARNNLPLSAGDDSPPTRNGAQPERRSAG